MTFDEEIKSRHEAMNKLLGWGTIVYFLVMGFALNQHELFEWTAPYERTMLEKSKHELSQQLQSESEALATSGKPLEAARRRVESAQLSLEARLLYDETRDARTRALGLIAASSVFSICYLTAIYLLFRKSVSKGHFIPLWAALSYGSLMSIATILTAVLTSIQ